MRRLKTVLVAFLIGVAPGVPIFGQGNPPRAQGARAVAPPAPDPAVALAKRREMEQILKTWEQRSAQLTSLAVRMTRTDDAPAWGAKVQYEGVAYIQAPDLAYLDFSKVEANKKIPHERIICTGTHILQYSHPSKQIFVYPIAQESRKRALEEGPLPFLFRLRAVDAQNRYDMTVLKQNQAAFLVSVLPRWASDREAFSKAYLLLNKSTYFPDKLVLVLPNEKDSKEYTFHEIKRNPPLEKAIFEGKMIQGWQVVQNPGPGPVAARPKRP